MKKIIGIFLAMLLIASCRNKEQLGPTLKVNIVTPLTVSAPSVDFSTGDKVFFTAVFENSAAWTITITDPTNKATKVITGVSKEINEANSSWSGTADVLPSFTAGSVTAVLSFQIDPSTNSVPFTISAKRIADKPTDVLVTNFVTAPIKNYGTGTFLSTDWPSDFPNTSNSDPSAFPDGSYPLPDGDKYLIMGPFNPHQGGGSPYVDLLRIYAPASMGNYTQFFPLNSDPTQVYFNIMVYNTGTPTWLQVSIFEGTDLDNPVRHIDIKPNWEGWKLVSVKYSDFVANSTDAAVNVQPNKASGIQLVLLSNLPTSDPVTLANTPVKAAFDHITFTYKAPYQP